jgi:hypothetical protein
MIFALNEKASAFYTGALNVGTQTKNGLGAVGKEGPLDLASQNMTDFWDAVWMKTEDTAQKIQQRVMSLGKSVAHSLQSGFANGFAAVGAALVNGQNLLSAFGSAILSSFGDILIMLGTQIMVVGALMTGVPFLFGLQGAAAVGAGIGMIIAGGALKAVSANMSAGNRGSSAGGAVGSPSTNIPLSGGVGEIGTLANANQPGTSASNVNVTVQGNVFNQRETGLEIARIIRDSFEQEGVTTVGAV